MKLTVFLLLTIIGSLSIGGGCWIAGYLAAAPNDEEYDRREIHGARFKIRIIAYKEKGNFSPGPPPGVYFVCESTAKGSNEWRRLLVKKGDEPHTIRPEQARFVTDEIAFLFMGTYITVTRDAGHTWQTWDGEQMVPLGDYRLNSNLSPYIEKVEINADGNGTMTLYPYFRERPRGPQLATKDYGITWEITQD